jgi:hypothetical protein
MNRKTTTVALLTGLAALIGVPATASPAELEPLQGYAIALGDRVAAVYFRQHDGRKELVTTLSSSNFQDERARHVAVLEPGASAVVPLTRSGFLLLEATDHDATVVIEVRPDLSAGGARAQVAEAD